MNKCEPAFDRDLSYGEQGELLVDNFLEWIARGNGRVEVKRKRRIDFELYVETSCDKGRKGFYKPSGINLTKADVWVFIVHETGIAIFIPTPLLKEFLFHCSVRDKEERDGSCPTKGKLVNLAALFRELDRKGKKPIKAK
jgi:hypothetical protein